jgi:hypothetical protein
LQRWQYYLISGRIGDFDNFVDIAAGTAEVAERTK